MEGTSYTKPPMFDRFNFSYWKSKMQGFFESMEFEVWESITEGYALPVERSIDIIKPRNDLLHVA